MSDLYIASDKDYIIDKAKKTQVLPSPTLNVCRPTLSDNWIIIIIR